jgi:hypothetical protein
VGPDLKENGASLYGRDSKKGFADATMSVGVRQRPCCGSSCGRSLGTKLSEAEYAQ